MHFFFLTIFNLFFNLPLVGRHLSSALSSRPMTENGPPKWPNVLSGWMTLRCRCCCRCRVSVRTLTTPRYIAVHILHTFRLNQVCLLICWLVVHIACTIHSGLVASTQLGATAFVISSFVWLYMQLCIYCLWHLRHCVGVCSLGRCLKLLKYRSGH